MDEGVDGELADVVAEAGDLLRLGLDGGGGVGEGLLGLRRRRAGPRRAGPAGRLRWPRGRRGRPTPRRRWPAARRPGVATSAFCARTRSRSAEGSPPACRWAELTSGADTKATGQQDAQRRDDRSQGQLRDSARTSPRVEGQDRRDNRYRAPHWPQAPQEQHCGHRPRPAAVTWNCNNRAGCGHVTSMPDSRPWPSSAPTSTPASPR